MSTSAVLVRSRRGKIVAGVCSGLARRFGLSTRAVRFAFVVSCLLPGPQFVAYVVLWIVVPKEA